jgi:site-specific DNA-cytosine methylase
VPATPKPLCVDLFCGLGGWSSAFLEEGYECWGFDIERHDYGTGVYPGQLVLQDVLTLHGSQFKDATVIVASPPCQAYSYRAMPWKRAKALPPPDNSLFEACFRIQREACEASGRYIPLIVENVKGAQKWVGRAAWHFGSYYLWGDIPALMPIAKAHQVPGFRFDGSGGSFQSAAVNATKNDGGSWFAVAHNTTSGHGQNPDGRKIPGQNWSHYKETGEVSPHWRMQSQKIPAYLYADRDSEGIKQHGSGPVWWRTGNGAMSSKSSRRKAAAAQIAKIPSPLAQHIAKVFKGGI